MMKIIESNMLDRYENVEYLYVFHDLVSHNVGIDLHYAVSKTYYFASGEKFCKQHEMLQEGLDAKDYKDESVCLDHVVKLNKLQLKEVQKSRRELYRIQKSAPASSSILNLIEFHEEVIGVYLEWFHKKNILIYSSIRSSGRPKGKTKRTIERYKKVFHQFEMAKKKYSSKTKAELYELLATVDYDEITYTRKTIRNIIEDKKYNLIPSR